MSSCQLRVAVIVLSTGLSVSGCGNSHAQPKPKAPSTALRCDGQSDDSAALGRLLQSGGKIVLPSGTCVIGDVLVSGVTLDLSGAAGRGTVLKGKAGATRTLLTMQNVRGSMRNISVDQAGMTGDGMGIVVSKAEGFVAQAMTVIRPNNIGLLFDHCIGCTLDGLTSPGGGNPGSWIVAFEYGRDNIITNVSSRNAINRTLVVEFERYDRITNISSLDGVAQTVFLEGVTDSVGDNWRYEDRTGKGLDDAFAVMGDTKRNRLRNLTAISPAGFGFTFAAREGHGAPKFNWVENLVVLRPGQQILSFTDNDATTGPSCNLVTRLRGSDANQQRGEFPAIDFFGAQNNAVFGRIISTDRKMRYAVIEVDHVDTGRDNYFRGNLDTGSAGRLYVANTKSRFRHEKGAESPTMSDIARVLPCLPLSELPAPHKN